MSHPIITVDNPNQRSAVYVATRNVYRYMLPSIQSLILNSNVEKIYLLIEDDELPYKLPRQCEIVNMSGQDVFTPENCWYYNSHWKHLILFRLMFDKLFSNLNKILSLDIDTIVQKDISDIWDINLDNYYFGAVEEIDRRDENNYYYNVGVLLCNLTELRNDNMSDIMVDAIKNKSYQYPEQDCINENCKNKILTIPPIYNSGVVGAPADSNIIHFACSPTHRWWENPIVQKYVGRLCT